MKKLIIIMAMALTATTANATSSLDHMTDEQYAEKKLDIARDLYIDAVSVLVANSDKPFDGKKAMMLEILQRYDYQIVCQAQGDSEEYCDGKSK